MRLNVIRLIASFVIASVIAHGMPLSADLSGWVVEVISDTENHTQDGNPITTTHGGDEYSLAVRNTEGREISISLTYPPIPKGTLLIVQSEQDSMAWTTIHELSNTTVRAVYPLIVPTKSIRPLFRLNEPPPSTRKAPLIKPREFIVHPHRTSGLIIYDIIAADESLWLSGEGGDKIELKRSGNGFERRVKRTVFAPESAQFLLLNPFRKRSNENLRFTYTEVQSDWTTITVPWDTTNDRLATIDQYTREWYDHILHALSHLLSGLGYAGPLLALGLPLILNVLLAHRPTLPVFVISISLAICSSLLLQFEGIYQKQNLLSLEAMRYVDAHRLTGSGSFSPFYVPINETASPYIYWRNVGRAVVLAMSSLMAGYILWTARGVSHSRPTSTQARKEEVEVMSFTSDDKSTICTDDLDKDVQEPNQQNWFSELFEGRTKSAPKQGWLETNRDYRERIYRLSKERLIEDITGTKPKQGFFESDDHYRSRISHEANVRIVEGAPDSKPGQRWFELDDEYRSRMAHEANKHIIADSTGSEPRQRWSETKEDFRNRIAHEAKERIIEKATGSAPKKKWSESDEDYRSRISREALDVKASSTSDDDNSSSAGCFITTACVEFANLRDDCHELTVLRAFRDWYVSHLPNGSTMLDEYYETAPRIVTALAQAPHREAVFEWILANVRSAVSLIETGDYGAALATYSNMFNKLKETCLPLEDRTLDSRRPRSI